MPDTRPATATMRQGRDDRWIFLRHFQIQARGTATDNLSLWTKFNGLRVAGASTFIRP